MSQEGEQFFSQLSFCGTVLRHANVITTSTYYIQTVPAQVSDAMELQQALAESLSGSEVATETINATASPAVN